MKKIILVLATALFFQLSLSAELNVLTVDMGELYNKYYKAKEAQQKFNSSVQSAQEEIGQMIEEGRALAEQFQEKVAKANNPALTEEARQKNGKEAEELQKQIRRKETEVTNYKQQTDQTLAARRQSIVQLHIEEIRDTVTAVAKEMNADFVLNSSGMSLVYSKHDSKNITAAVLAKLNADAPAK